MKVAVVGVGGVGSAAVRWFAEAGHHVVAFEQFPTGHTWGSSHGQSRIIHYTYPDAIYTRMMREAYPLWLRLQERAGEELLVPCGGIFFGPCDTAAIHQAEAALKENGVPHQLLSSTEAAERFPAVRWRPDDVALYQGDMGYLRPERCVRASVCLARAAGAAVLEETPVKEVGSGNGGATVLLESGERCKADRVLVTAGPWMGKLLASLQLPLRATRQQVVYLKVETDVRLPVWIDAETLFYGFPQEHGNDSVKLASHLLGDTVSPDSSDRTVDDDYILQIQDYAQSRFRGVTRQVIRAEACLYTNTPDEDFVIDTPPELPNVWLVSGCSGHGFKFTELLGKIAAALVTDGPAPDYLPKFSLRRFMKPS